MKHQHDTSPPLFHHSNWIARRLRWFRENILEIRQNELAALLNTTQSNVSKWENGAVGIDERTIDKIAALAHMSHKELLYGSFNGASLPVIGKLTEQSIVIFENKTASASKSTDFVDVANSNLFHCSAIRVGTNAAWPKYQLGDIIIVDTSQVWPTSKIINHECLIQTPDDKTVIGHVFQGNSSKRYTILPFNCPPIQNTSVDWATPVILVKKQHP